MTYKDYCPHDRRALFMYVLDLNIPEKKKGRVLKRMYEEYRITHEMYTGVDQYISETTDRDISYFLTNESVPIEDNNIAINNTVTSSVPGVDKIGCTSSEVSYNNCSQ